MHTEITTKKGGFMSNKKIMYSLIVLTTLTLTSQASGMCLLKLCLRKRHVYPEINPVHDGTRAPQNSPISPRPVLPQDPCLQENKELRQRRNSLHDKENILNKLTPALNHAQENLKATLREQEKLQLCILTQAPYQPQTFPQPQSPRSESDDDLSPQQHNSGAPDRLIEMPIIQLHATPPIKTIENILRQNKRLDRELQENEHEVTQTTLELKEKYISVQNSVVKTQEDIRDLETCLNDQQQEHEENQ